MTKSSPLPIGCYELFFSISLLGVDDLKIKWWTSRDNKSSTKVILNIWNVLGIPRVQYQLSNLITESTKLEMDFHHSRF